MLLTMVAAFAIASVSGQSQPAASGEVQSASATPNVAQKLLSPRTPVLLASDYVIGPGDVLQISVWQEPQFAESLVVRPDGKISMPLVPDISLIGLTPHEAEETLAQKLLALVKHPRVSVIVQEIHSRLVYITGEVQHPGAYPMIGSINVIQLIAHAGGPTEFAKKKAVYVLHPDNREKTRVDYQKVLQGQHLEENVQLIPGDTVVVP
ncbi:MAG: polysaccharide biosynthesis/export family protein [Acidobacteriaceae bacterium]